MLKDVNSQKGIIPPILLILIAAVGIMVYLLLTSILPFRDKLFSLLYPKPSSYANEQSVPDEILLKFKAGVNDKVKDAIRGEHGLSKVDEISQIGVERVKVPQDKKEQILEALSRNPRIEYAEANFLAQIQDTPNDSLYSSQWQLSKVGASGAWDINQGSPNIIVAVVDTGVYGDHEDLAAKLVPGYNFYDNNSDTSDVHGHGTLVVGAAASATNNSKGVASLGRNIMVMPLRAGTSTGAVNLGFAANSVTYAVDHGAKIVNLSFGAGIQNNTLQVAIDYAWNKGVVIVAPAGNNGTTPILYPASGNNVIAVGGTDQNDKWASSNYGLNLDVVAPMFNYSTKKDGGYQEVSGTSFGSSIVAALAGLIMSVNSGLTNSQVVDIINSTALDLGDPGWDQYYGNGRIQADKALLKATTTAPASDTSAPTVSISSPTGGSTISGLIDITADASDNVAVTKVEFYVDGVLLGPDILSPYIASWDTTSLTNGSSHNISAKAYDLAGNTGNSTTVTVTVNNPVSSLSPTPTTSTSVSVSSDTTKPIVAITSPLDGTTLKANSKVNIQASATDNIKIAKVEFYTSQSTSSICTSAIATGPYVCRWTLPGKKNTSYTLTVKATDTSNNTNSTSITVKAQ